MYDSRSQHKTEQNTGTVTYGYLPSGTTLTAYTQVGDLEYGQVESWRGKRRVRDSNGFLPPNEFTLLKSNLTRRKFNENLEPCGKLTQHWFVSGYDYVADVDKNAILCVYKLPELKPTISQPIESNFSPMGEHALKFAQAQAWAKANDPDLPGFTWIGEARETLVWMRDIISSVMKATIKYKSALANAKKYAKSAGELADRTSSLWLQYRYAVTPLYLQVQEAIALFKERNDAIETITGYVARETLESTTQRVFTWSGLTLRVTTKEFLDFRGACKLYPTANTREGLDLGFKPHDLLSAAWELTRLSFVIDWFVDVGTFISAWRPGDAKIAYQSNTIVNNIRREVETEMLSHNYPAYYHTVVYEPEAVTYTRSFVKRTTEVERPLLPALNVKALSLFRQIDAVALAFTALRGLK